jgi:hypothetical protein
MKAIVFRVQVCPNCLILNRTRSADFKSIKLKSHSPILNYFIQGRPLDITEIPPRVLLSITPRFASKV